MNEIFKFDEGQSARTIEIGLLSKSLMVRDVKGGAPKNRPIQSWELVDLVHSEALNLGLKATVKDIYVAQSGSNPIISREEKKLYEHGDNIPVNKWLFNRVAFMITIAHTMDNTTTTAIVGTFHEKGIQIAFGQHVHVCSNMCIFGSNLMQTYGENRMPFEKMEEMISKWLHEFEEKRSKDMEIIRLMQEYQIQPDEMQGLMDSMVGNLFRKAVRKNYFQGDDVVFNMTQCGDFVKQMETRIVTAPENETAPAISMWDVYNWGTEILSPMRTDITTVYQTNHAWGSFLGNFLAWDTKPKPIIIESVPVKKGRNK